MTDDLTDDKIKIPDNGEIKWSSIKPYVSLFQERSDWRCKLFGSDDFIFIPLKDHHPNWFWRKMQFICFGNRWEKNK